MNSVIVLLYFNYTAFIDNVEFSDNKKNGA